VTSRLYDAVCTVVGRRPPTKAHHSIDDATAAWCDNNQSGVTSCDNFLPIRRVDRSARTAVPARSRVVVTRRVLMLTASGWTPFDCCRANTMMDVCLAVHQSFFSFLGNHVLLLLFLAFFHIFAVYTKKISQSRNESHQLTYWKRRCGLYGW